MYCFKDRFYYQDCERFQKHCCRCNNLDHVCCKSKLSLKSDVGVQTDFTDKQTNNYKKHRSKYFDRTFRKIK